MTTPHQNPRVLRRIRITGWTALSALLTTVVGFAAWAYTPYPADDDAVRAVFSREDLIVSADAHHIVLTARQENLPLSNQAMLFLPGARVEPHAYAATFADFVSSTGMTVVIVRPLANLALLDPRGVEDFAALSPDPITAVGGHSLGGVKACQLATEQIRTLILFASYCVNDLSQSDLRVVSLTGSRDGLTDLAALNSAAALLPTDAQSEEIIGANHASFADYGPQRGDMSETKGRAEVVKEITRVLEGLVDDWVGG